MPFVQLNLGKKLNEEQKNSLQLKVGEIMPLISGKNIKNTIQQIIDDCSLYSGGEKIEGAYVEARLYLPATKEDKTAWSNAISQLLIEDLGIKAEQIYLNIVEMTEWGTGKGYR